MKEINKLEEYLQERSAKRKKRNRFLAILFSIIVIGILGIAGFWGYSNFGDEASSTNSGSNGDQVADNRNLNESPVQIDNGKKFPSLSIEGNFEVGKILFFTILNSDKKEKHMIDFGDGESMNIMNSTRHVYRKVGEYQIKFKPAGTEEAVVETINVQKRNSNGDNNFVKVIETSEASESEKAFVSFSYDSKASFPGGTTALMAYLQTHIGDVSGYEGRVLVSFNVKQDGSIGDLKIVDSVNKKLDTQVLSAFDGMPKWNPAKKDGEEILSEYRLPFYFKKET